MKPKVLTKKKKWGEDDAFWRKIKKLLKLKIKMEKKQKASPFG